MPESGHDAMLTDSDNTDSLIQQISQVGAKIKVLWTAEEVTDSGWRPGWYLATIQGYQPETDTIVLAYSSEPDNIYEDELIPLIANEKVQLIWTPS